MAASPISAVAFLLLVLIFAVMINAVAASSRPPSRNAHRAREDLSYIKFVSNTTDFQLEDYRVIMGDGTAGCPLAATLSSRFGILLIERGGVAYGNRNLMTQEGFLASLMDVHASYCATEVFTSEVGLPNVQRCIFGSSAAVNASVYAFAEQDQSCEWVARAIGFKDEYQLAVSHVGMLSVSTAACQERGKLMPYGSATLIPSVVSSGQPNARPASFFQMIVIALIAYCLLGEDGNDSDDDSDYEPSDSDEVRDERNLMVRRNPRRGVQGRGRGVGITWYCKDAPVPAAGPNEVADADAEPSQAAASGTEPEPDQSLAASSGHNEALHVAGSPASESTASGPHQEQANPSSSASSFVPPAAAQPIPEPAHGQAPDPAPAPAPEQPAIVVVIGVPPPPPPPPPQEAAAGQQATPTKLIVHVEQVQKVFVYHSA